MEEQEPQEMQSNEALPQGKEEISPFYTEIERFVAHVVSLRNVTPLIMRLLGVEVKQLDERITPLLEEHAVEKQAVDKGTVYILKGDAAKEIKPLITQYRHLRIAGNFLPKSFIVTLVGQYDAFLGRILRWAFYYHPELLHQVDNTTLSYSQIANFATIDEAREYIAEKVSERVLRESHMEQIRWIEKKLKVPLRQQIDIWPKFVEITERRNLFVHTDGEVSEQYLRVCREYNVPLPAELNKDTRLNVSQGYFQEAVDTIYEVGVIIGQLVWRKMARDDLDLADHNLITLSYDLLISENYDLAIRLLTFATDKVKHFSEENFLYMVINKAQAYKWKGDENTCREILKSIDWSAKSLKFKLAVHVLKDEFAAAAKIMHQIGANSEEISKVDYHEWPLFQKFRSSDEFRKAYKEIFGEEYSDIFFESENER